MKAKCLKRILLGLAPALSLLTTNAVFAHCDTLDGPVVSDARTALERKDPAPVLKWIQPGDELELKAAFARTLAVRPQSTEARELADQFFFETLVRLHRQGEGAPFTGLKPAGTTPDPAVAAADRALKTGNPDALIRTVTDETTANVRKRFADAAEKRKHADESVDAGREYVAAYVAFVHYVEALHGADASVEKHGGTEPAATHAHTD